MNSLDALKLMVRHYPGGVEAMAVRLNKPKRTLEQELLGSQAFKLGVLDASAISSMCIEVDSAHALAWLNAEAANCGVRVDLQPGGVGAALDPMQAMSVAVREMADVTEQTVVAMADGSISANDRKRIQREITEAMDALQQLQRAVDAAAKKAVRHA